MEFSIIIPAYNIEKYIARTLDSILSQKLPLDKFEIIIVNDGSIDNTVEIIEKYLKRFDNIKLISINNSGPSIARNTAIKMALGRYIMFIDADDIIVENSLFPLLEYTKNRDEDIIGLKFSKIDEKGTVSEYHNQKFPVNKKMKGKDFLRNNNIIGVVWGYLFKTSFLKRHKLEMIPGIYHQDEEFVSRSFYFAESIIISEYFTYLYFYNREESIINTATIEHKERLIRNSLVVINALNNIALSENGAYKYLIKKLSYLSLDVIRLLIRENHSDKFINETIYELKKAGIYPLPLKPYGLKFNLFSAMICNTDFIRFWRNDSDNILKKRIKQMI